MDNLKNRKEELGAGEEERINMNINKARREMGVSLENDSEMSEESFEVVVQQIKETKDCFKSISTAWSTLEEVQTLKRNLEAAQCSSKDFDPIVYGVITNNLQDSINDLFTKRAKLAEDAKSPDNDIRRDATEKLVEFNTGFSENWKKLNNLQETYKRLEKQGKIDDLKALLSDDPTTQKIAEEKAVTRRFLEIWRSEEMQTQGLQNTYEEAEEAVKKDINNPSKQEELYSELTQINEKLRNAVEDEVRNLVEDKTKDSTKEDINQEDLNPFQLALKDAIVEVRNHNRFAEKWPTDYERWFNFGESWLQAGMEKLGIKPENIKESHDKLLASTYAREVISNEVGNSANKVAYDCLPDKIVQTCEELIRADAQLKYIHSHLSSGVPAIPMPDHISGRDVLETPGERMRCMLYSLIKVGNPKLEWSLIREMADPIAKTLVREKLAEQDQMLDLNESAGQKAKELLTDNSWIEPERGLLVYQWNKGKMRCDEVWPRTVNDSSRPWYAVRLRAGFHFDAMSEPE